MFMECPLFQHTSLLKDAEFPALLHSLGSHLIIAVEFSRLEWPHGWNLYSYAPPYVTTVGLGLHRLLETDYWQFGGWLRCVFKAWVCLASS